MWSGFGEEGCQSVKFNLKFKIHFLEPKADVDESDGRRVDVRAHQTHLDGSDHAVGTECQSRAGDKAVVVEPSVINVVHISAVEADG